LLPLTPKAFFTFLRNIRTVGLQRNTRRPPPPPPPTFVLHCLSFVFKTASLINLEINPMRFLLNFLQIAQSSSLTLRPSTIGFRPSINFSEAKWGQNFYISHLFEMAFNRLLATLRPLRAIEHVTSPNCPNTKSSALSRTKINSQGLISPRGSHTNYVKPFLERLAEYPCWCITNFINRQPFKPSTLLQQDNVKMNSPCTFKYLKYYYKFRFFKFSASHTRFNKQ
jgi:hypothetical protein